MNNEKNRFLIFLCILLVTSIANAQQQVSEQEAQNAAINALYSKTEILKVSPNSQIKTLHSFKNNRENTLMYEVIFQNRATILLSGTKACLPVLGCYMKPEEDKGSIFDINNADVPDGLKALLKDYSDEMEWCFAQTEIELFHEKEWNELLKPNNPMRITPTTIIVAPMLSTKWDQQWSNNGDCPAYNYYVTKTSSYQCSDEDCDNRCPLGCAAVAMGQVMKKWNYPVYTDTRIYDWCNMPDKLLSYSSNYIRERHAIAQLLKDCGDAANTFYCVGRCNSSTLLLDIQHAFRSHFNYHALHSLRSSHTASTWKRFLREDLDQGKPVIYGSLGLNADGHYWVCDGYSSEELFHFNWGWRGMYDDDWFVINGLGNFAGSNYNVSQRAVFEIYPNETQDYCDFNVNIYSSVPPVVTNCATNLTIEFTSPIYNAIHSGQSVEYVAHNSIILKPGFHAKSGSNVHAHIEPCAGCNSATVIMKNSNDSAGAEEKLYIAVGNDEEKHLLDRDKILADEPQVYPNPTTGLLTIHAKNNNDYIQTVELHSTHGVKLVTFSGNQSFFQEIDISHLPSQVYILKIQVSEQTFTKKLILQK